MNLWEDTCQFCQQAKWLIVSILTLVFVAWGVWGWREVSIWYEDTAPAVEFSQGTVADNDLAYPSEVIVFYQPVKKLRNCDGMIHRVVTGQCGYFVISDKHSTLEAGFEGRLTIPVQVPYEAIPGQCVFQIHARYYCNPFDFLLQRQVFVSPAIPFTVRSWGN